jgi:hypothetical protein
MQTQTGYDVDCLDPLDELAFVPISIQRPISPTGDASISARPALCDFAAYLKVTWTANRSISGEYDR